MRGFQGSDPGAPGRLLACAKHFAGYGAAGGGRDYDSAYIPEDLLWNVYLLPFRAALDAGVATFMSAYMDLNDVPATANRFLLDATGAPLYPFGFGLSYAAFAYSYLRRAGDEVVQIYIHQRAGSASRPVRELKGFERVSLAPGQKKTVHFSLGKDELSFSSPQEKRWVEESENFDVWIGGDSTAVPHATFQVTPE